MTLQSISFELTGLGLDLSESPDLLVIEKVVSMLDRR
jgi:hypothetical protein